MLAQDVSNYLLDGDVVGVNLPDPREATEYNEELRHDIPVETSHRHEKKKALYMTPPNESRGWCAATGAKC